MMNGDSAPSVTVAIVTFNSASYIERCLDEVLRQDYHPVRVIVVDNASEDDTVSLLHRYRHCVRLIRNETNVGFAAGQNQAIRASDSDWVLTLNPDVRLNGDFVAKLVEGGESDPGIGTVCGKLLAMGPDFEVPAQPRFDSTGMYMTPNFRHLDRGSREPDDGRYDKPEWVFGATAAAALYRRRMIDDISVNGEFFDEDFFAYREDADVAWRAQLLGWKCLYWPAAAAYHVRTVLPSNRRSLPAAVNMHSVKNRFLLRIKNTTGPLYRRHLTSITTRDLAVVAGCLLREWTSLPAFPHLIREFGRTWAKRRAIMSKRRADDRYIASWFHDRPVSFPAALPQAAQSTEGKRVGA
jgi:GT2 family glycosyltransferase